jgi:hypothetical protein
MKRGPEALARAAKAAAETRASEARGIAATNRGGAKARRGTSEVPSPYRAAMTWLSEQAERESKTAKPERRAMFARAKDTVRSLFGMKQQGKGVGAPKGGAKQKMPKRRRRSTAAR